MKKLLLVLLLTGCTTTYSKVEVDDKVSNLDKRIRELAAFAVNLNNSVNTLNEHNFPQAMKVSRENNNCAVNVKTAECIKGK